jgi:hypothetical protein
VQFEVIVAVERENRDAAACAQSDGAQRAGEATHAL